MNVKSKLLATEYMSCRLGYYIISFNPDREHDAPAGRFPVWVKFPTNLLILESVHLKEISILYSIWQC